MWNLYINYFSYTKDTGKNLIMVTINNGSRVYQFSTNEANSIWNHNQWGNEYEREQIPKELNCEELDLLDECIDRNLVRVLNVIPKC